MSVLFKSSYRVINVVRSALFYGPHIQQKSFCAWKVRFYVYSENIYASLSNRPLPKGDDGKWHITPPSRKNLLVVMRLHDMMRYSHFAINIIYFDQLLKKSSTLLILLFDFRFRSHLHGLNHLVKQRYDIKVWAVSLPICSHIYLILYTYTKAKE